MSQLFRQESAFRSPEGQPGGSSLAELFHENTKNHRPIHFPNTSEDTYTVKELDAMTRAYKQYRRRPRVALPEVQSCPAESFDDIIRARRTNRKFGSGELALAELSALMQWSYGISAEAVITGGGVQRLRAAPSAGALYPAEIYLGVRSVGGLDAGIYHYEVPDHTAALLSHGDASERLQAVCCGQEYAREAAVVVLIAGVIERTRRKYGNRGYRYVLLDVGHLAQNLCLAATVLGLSITTTCGFFDDEAADLIGIDGCDEAVLYVAFVGKPSCTEISCHRQPRD